MTDALRETLATKLLADHAGADLDVHHYDTANGLVPYPGGRTKREWLLGPALDSYVRAADLPCD